MTVERVAPDPVVVKRHNELFDLYGSWPGDPDDDPEFVAQAREIMGLPPLAEPVAAGHDITQTRSLDTSGEDMDETELDEELDEEDEPEPAPYEPLDAAAAQRALDDGSLRLRRILEDRGKDVTPGHDQLHHYWTKDPRGLAKWVKSPHPGTALHRHLMKYVGSERAWRMANEWHHEVFGIWIGEKKGANKLGPG